MTRMHLDMTRGALILSGLLALGSCEEKASISPEPGASGGTSGSVAATGGTAGGTAGLGGASGNDSGPTTLACPSGTAGAKQILVKTASGNAYCIDQLETTRGDYKAFLDAKAGDMTGQPPECKLNARYAPLIPDPTDPEGYLSCPEESWSLEKYPDHPVVCVDFCDAFAYCKWVGKRLCGQIGVSGASMQTVASPNEIAGSSAAEWSYACSNGGKTQYPYGDTYQAAACIDKARFDAQGTASTLPKIEGEICHGVEPPFDGIYHLSGSVSEWTNICRPDGTNCAKVGGQWPQPPEYLTCSHSGLGSVVAPQGHEGGNVYTGFRCCADSVEVPSP